ncbi:MAG: GPP34 family phosphoprotein, partial [Candidatus Krumholzibacteria bacterium]|nr:GPP34 family phosphoprotein [Candidatus Krumholzibacteria bacterium]
MNKQLFLHEEIMLLALRDREGTVASGTNFQYAIGGAVLAELLLEGRVAVETKRKKKYLQLTDSTPLGNTVIDECLRKVADAKKRAQLQTWVSRFASVKKLKHKVAKQLCRRGILRSDEDKVLLIFSRRIYPEINPEPERRIMDRLKETIFTDTENVEPRTAVLLSLAKSADVLKVNFDKKELKGRKDRIERIINGEVAGKATKEAIEAMQAVVMMSIITSTY